MKTDQIESLVQDLKPVSPMMPSYRTTLILFLGSGIVAAVLLIFLWGTREHLEALWVTDIYRYNFFALLFLSLIFASLLSLGRLPAFASRRNKLSLLVIPSFALGLLVYHWHSGHSAESWTVGWPCSERILLMSFPILFLTVWLLRRGAPVYRRTLAIQAGIFSVAAPAFVLPLVCENQEAFHLLSAHFATPALLLSIFAALVVPKFLRW